MGDLSYDYFYPRSPCGERHDTSSLMQCQAKFLSTLSLRRATVFNLFSNPGSTISIHALLAESDVSVIELIQRRFVFLSTLSLRRATARSASKLGGMSISIHALLAESDNFRRAFKRPVANFYPRSPCGERLLSRHPTDTAKTFLSTLSLRRATPFSRCVPMMRPYFYPRSPCGERPITCCLHMRHAVFLSTLSLRRATPRACPV